MPTSTPFHYLILPYGRFMKKRHKFDYFIHGLSAGIVTDQFPFRFHPFLKRFLLTQSPAFSLLYRPKKGGIYLEALSPRRPHF